MSTLKEMVELLKQKCSAEEMVNSMLKEIKSEEEMSILKVMSFNLRVESPGDGINRFSLRTERVLDAIRSEDPDLIGFQETTEVGRVFLREALKDEYYLIGGGSRQHYRKGGAAIAFKRNVFELIALETKWLSPAPDVPGSRYEDSDQSIYPRHYHLAKLRVNATNKVFYFLNTHPDHMGVNVRALETKQIMEALRPLVSLPIIMTGDFNAQPNEKSIRQILEDSSLGMVDVTEQLGGTYHAFGKVNPPLKVDYIFANMPCVESHSVENIPINGVYISDHDPIVATLKFIDKADE